MLASYAACLALVTFTQSGEVPCHGITYNQLLLYLAIGVTLAFDILYCQTVSQVA